MNAPRGLLSERRHQLQLNSRCLVLVMRIFSISVLLTVCLAGAVVAQADLVISKGVAHHVGRHDNRGAVVTFGTDTLTLVIDGHIRFFRRGPKTTLEILYSDILSTTYDEGPINRYLLIRYRHGNGGDAVELALDRDVASRVIASLEARSGVRVTHP